MGLDNWRGNLGWPKHVSTEDAVIEHLFERDGKTESNFSEENALAALLLSEAAFLNSNWWEDDWPERARKSVSININTNDVFAWGCADAESIGHAEIEEVYRYWVKDPSWGTAIWAMIRNKSMPQGPVAKSIRAGGIWDLDALQQEHGLRANYYDGVSGVLARQKRERYESWCRSHNQEILPYDAGWWKGWDAYTKAFPGWNSPEWKAEEERRIAEWKAQNGWAE